MKDGDIFLEQVRRRNELQRLWELFTWPDYRQIRDMWLYWTEYLRAHKN